MEVLNISFGDGSLTDVIPEGVTPIPAKLIKFAGLDDGTNKGNPSIHIAMRLTDDEGDADGVMIVSETTWRLLYTACMAYQARWGIPQ
jgi:hypothetical protein